ncbi:MAG: serine protease [Firmicutes bacterium]|nr:serine protease [Bacillota bacterium]
MLDKMREKMAALKSGGQSDILDALLALGDDFAGASRLGKLYLSGVGVDKCVPSALKCFAYAAGRGCVEAKQQISLMHKNGLIEQSDFDLYVGSGVRDSHDFKEVAKRARAATFEIVAGHSDSGQSLSTGTCFVVRVGGESKANGGVEVGGAIGVSGGEVGGAIYTSGGGKFFVLTNHHIVFAKNTTKPYKFIAAVLDNGKGRIAYELKLLASDEGEDIALLQFANEMGAPLDNYFEMGCSDTLWLGQPVFTYGNPLGNGLALSEGVVSNPKEDYRKSKTHQKDLIRTSITLYNGNSGGPLFNTAGQVVGMITFIPKNKDGEKVPGWSFAVSTRQILKLIRM